MRIHEGLLKIKTAMLTCFQMFCVSESWPKHAIEANF